MEGELTRAWRLLAIDARGSSDGWMPLAGRGCGRGSYGIGWRVVAVGVDLSLYGRIRWRGSCLGSPLAHPENCKGFLRMSSYILGSVIGRAPLMELFSGQV
ncbi:hypothetical protein Tco_0324388 [Tanacetum coccineum]